MIPYNLGNFRYRNNQYDRYEFPGGYATPKQSYAVFDIDFHFYVRDHLGSNVMVLNNTGIEQQTRYYPFGGIVTQNSTNNTNNTTQPNHNKYTGKEFDRMHGLDWYDYVARQYDPVYGRFTSIDPLCEKYPYLSPYAYCENNPILFVDPTGEKPKKKEAAIMAEDVYSPGENNIPGGWRFIRKTSYDSGFLGALYGRKNKKTGEYTEYVFATAGTELTSYKDWINNITQLLGLSEQYAQSIHIASGLSERYNKKSKELTYVGHSLGGGLASANALKTGNAAITFNAAGLSPMTKAVHGLYGKQADITAYVVRGEILDFIQRDFRLRAEGNIRYINPPKAFSRFIPLYVNYLQFKYHSIEYINSLLK